MQQLNTSRRGKVLQENLKLERIKIKGTTADNTKYPSKNQLITPQIHLKLLEKQEKLALRGINCD
jgi:hypothetical protein